MGGRGRARRASPPEGRESDGPKAAPGGDSVESRSVIPGVGAGGRKSGGPRRVQR